MLKVVLEPLLHVPQYMPADIFVTRPYARYDTVEIHEINHITGRAARHIGVVAEIMVQ